MRHPTPVRVHGRRALAGCLAVLAASLALVASWPTAAAGDAGAVSSVGAARSDLEQARESLDALLAGVDATAEAFERASAHHLRLSGELAHAHEAVRRADVELASAREQLALRAAAAYQRPEAELALGEAVLVAPDPATAFHRVALVGVVGARDARMDDLEAARARAAQRLRQQQILAAGTAGSAADLQGRADALTEAVSAARARSQQARATLSAAESDAAAAQRRAHEQLRAAELAAHLPEASSPAPVGGKVCPVGLPNGFVDSWGFPRSGGRQHQGVDIFAPSGTPLYAVAGGTIQRVGHSVLGGLFVHLVDDAGDRHYYAHLDEFAVQSGQRVAAGDVVGTVGNTGNARTTPPHLHWEHHPGDGPAVNPYPLARALCRR